MVLVWPNWFGLDHNDLITTKMKWSRPKWIGQVQMWFILVENHNLDLTNSFWSWPFHFGRDQIIMVYSKSIWSDQNHFGPTKTVLVTWKDKAYNFTRRFLTFCNMPRSKVLKTSLISKCNFIKSLKPLQGRLTSKIRQTEARCDQMAQD